jgi:hypothetical protein
MGWVRHVVRVGEKINTHRTLIEKHEGKRPLERPTGRWEGNSKIRVKEIGWVDVDSIHLGHDRNKWASEVRSCRVA